MMFNGKPIAQRRRPFTGAKQKGVALIMALMVFALVSAIAASIMTLLARERDVVSQVQTSIALKNQLLGGEAWAIHYFATLDEVSLPSLASSRWGLVQQTFPLDKTGDTMKIALVDRQSCFNINALADEKKAELAYQQLQRLLSALQQDAALADQIKDWIDSDQDITGSNGHEDEFYQGLSPSFRSADTLVVSESEFQLWQWEEKVRTTLWPWLCFWPEDVGVNINRLPAELQTALLPELTEEQKTALASRLNSAGFDSVESFINDESVREQNLQAADWRTDMAFVDAFVQVTMSERTMSLHSRLYKATNGQIVRYYRSYGPHDALLSTFALKSTKEAEPE